MGTTNLLWGRFELIREETEKWRGTARIYRDIKTGEYYAASWTTVSGLPAEFFDGESSISECLVFPYDNDLRVVTDWLEVAGGRNYSFEQAMHDLLTDLEHPVES